MGKPKEISPARIGESYNWGEFGSANRNGISLSPTATQTVRDTQSGINQYVNELINPSYNNESFRARQELIDANNQLYANRLGANAIDRGARGSATQNILNSIMANRNNDLRQAMTQEDARVRNVLDALSGIEGNYFNQGNIMANNILSRITANQGVQNAANTANTANYNAWRNKLINTGVATATTLIGSPAMGALVAGAMEKANPSTPQVTGYTGGVTNDGMYGSYIPY